MEPSRTADVNDRCKDGCAETEVELRILKSIGERPLHVWVAPVDGGIDCYGALAAALPFKSVGLEAKNGGADSRDRDSQRAQAERCLRVLEMSRAPMPFVLGGWCAGGVLAYEMAMQLRERGRLARLVVLIDSDIRDTGSGMGASSEYRPGVYDGSVLLVRTSHNEWDWRRVAPYVEVEEVASEPRTILSLPTVELVACLVRWRAAFHLPATLRGRPLSPRQPAP